MRESESLVLPITLRANKFVAHPVKVRLRCESVKIERCTMCSEQPTMTLVVDVFGNLTQCASRL